MSMIVAGIGPVTAQTRSDNAQSLELEEVVVTAQRREQSIQEVANSLEVIGGGQIDLLGQVEFEDYLNTVSGVGFIKSGEGSNRVALRGIASFNENQYGFSDSVSTVGVYLDDVPIAGSASLPDLALYDLNRIEVLKGPQGTLYGEGAMGGAIRMITNAPRLDALSAKTEATMSSTQHGGMNYQVRGAVNLPIVEDRLAVRLVSSYRDDSGFIDNVATGRDDVNDLKQWSGRMQLRAQLTDRFSADFLYLHDDQEVDGFNRQTFGLGDLQTNLLENEFNDNIVDVGALTLRYDFDVATLSSVSSYSETDRHFSSRFPAGFNNLLGLFGLTGLASPSEALGFDDHAETFTQELRLVSQGDNRVDWIAGAFYRDRERDVCAAADVPVATAANTLLNASGLGAFAFPASSTPCETRPATGLDVLERISQETFEQTALYAETNIELSPQFELTLGARWFDEETTLTDLNTYFGVLSILNAPARQASVSDSDVLFKAGLAWSVSEQQLIYLNASQGFRSGGPNLNSSFIDGRFTSYRSDSLWNYELGSKSTWLDGRLIVNGAVYFLDWSDIQSSLLVFSPLLNNNVNVWANAGNAEVVGLDLQMTVRPTEALELGASLNLQDAKFTEVVPETQIVADSALPNAPDLTVYGYTQYTWPLAQAKVFARLDYRFVDEQNQSPIVIGGNPDPRTLKSYSLANLYLGYQTDKWHLTAFVNNVADERAYTEVTRLLVGGVLPDTAAVIQPRTVGVTVGFNFE